MLKRCHRCRKLIYYNGKCLNLSKKGLDQIDWTRFICEYWYIHPTIFWVLRFSLYYLVITAIEFFFFNLIFFPLISNFTLVGIDTIATVLILVLLCIISIVRIIIYYYLFKIIVKLLKKDMIIQILKQQYLRIL